MKILKTLSKVAVLAALLAPASAHAGFFWSNYPDVKWKTFETEHFVFHYYEESSKDHPNTTEYTARRAAKYAEIMYPKVCEQFNHFLKEKVHVVVRDQEDISNGFAVYTEDWITIWATPLYYRLRGRMDWIPDVMTHEFAHVVSLKANEVRGVGVSFGASAGGIEEDGRNDVAYGAELPFGEGNSAPFWWTEGGAEYWTHQVGYNHWGSSRDMLLRMSYLDPDSEVLTLDQLGVRGDKTGLDGERGYNHGYSIGLYLAEKYGQETYSKFAEASKSKYRFDWENVIKEVLGITPEQMWAGWKQWNQDKYNKVKEEIEKQGHHEGVELTWTEPQWRTKDEKKAKAWKELPLRERRYKREKLGLGNYYPEVSPTGNAYGTLDTRRGALKITFVNPDELPAFTGVWLDPEKKADGGSDEGASKPSTSRSLSRGFAAEGDDGKPLSDKEKLERIPSYTITGVNDSDWGFSPDGTKVVVNMARLPGCFGSYELDGYEWDDLVVVDLTKALAAGEKKRQGKSKGPIEFGCMEANSFKKQITNEMRATQPSWSPDGQWIAFLKYGDGTYNVWKIRPDGTEPTPLTKFTDGAQIGEPRWSPDARKLTFYLYREDQQDIWEMNADGTDLHPLTWDKAEDKDSVYVDNDTILFSSDRTNNIFNIFKLDTKTGKVTQITNVIGGAFSPALTKEGNLMYAGFTAFGHQNFGLKKSEFYNEEVEPYKLPGEKQVSTLLATSEELPPIPPTRKYSAIKDMQPPVFFPVGRYDNQNVQAGGALIWWDYAGKHALFAQGMLGQSQDYIVQYVNDMWYPTLSLIWARFIRSRELGFEYAEDQVGELKLRQQVDFWVATADMQIGRNHGIGWSATFRSFDVGFGSDGADLETDYPWEYGQSGISSSFTTGFRFDYRTFDPNQARGSFDINPRGAREISTSWDFGYSKVVGGDVDDGQRLESYGFNTLQVSYAEYIAAPWLEYLEHTLQFTAQAGFVDQNVQYNDELFAGGQHPYSSFNRINVNTEFAGFEPFSVIGETMLIGSVAYRLPLYRDWDKKIGPFYFDSVYLQFFGTAGNLWSFRPRPSELEDGTLGIAPLNASGNIREMPFVGLFNEKRREDLETQYSEIPIEGMNHAYGRDDRKCGSDLSCGTRRLYEGAFPVAYKNGNRILTDIGAEVRVRAYAYNYNTWFSFFRLAYGLQDTAGVGDQNGDRIFRDLPPNDDPVGEIEKAGFRYYIGIGTGW